MSGFIENTAHNASDKSDRREVVMNLGTASRMVPLVRGIVDDVLEARRRLAELEPEQERLDRERRSLDWPLRSRRYQLREEIEQAQKALQTALHELDHLGVSLVDAVAGRVGFPTLVNSRQAFFSWLPGEERLASWHYAGEDARRPIPPAWFKAADVRLVGQR